MSGPVEGGGGVSALVIGSGESESALARALQSQGNNVISSSDNIGMLEASVDGFAHLLPDPDTAVDFVLDKDIDLVVIGDQEAIHDGWADLLRYETSANIFAPSHAAARLATSRVYAAQVADRVKIPQAPYTIHTDAAEFMAALAVRAPWQTTLKTDDTTDERGVVYPDTIEGMFRAGHDMISGATPVGFGASRTMIVERINDHDRDGRAGVEFSLLGISDGNPDSIVFLPVVQKYSRLLNEDKGPHTSGMGAYGPVPEWLLPTTVVDRAKSAMFDTVDYMKSIGVPIIGVISGGFKRARQIGLVDPELLSYDVRFNGPEGTVLMQQLAAAGVDLADLLMRASDLEGGLGAYELPRSLGEVAAVTVCAVSEGYPGDPATGRPVFTKDTALRNAGIVIDPAAMRRNAPYELVTTGGRVFSATACSDTVKQAAHKVQGAVDGGLAGFYGLHRRTDIAMDAIIGKVLE